MIRRDEFFNRFKDVIGGSLYQKTYPRKVDRNNLVVAGQKFNVYNPYFDWSQESDEKRKVI
jgi:hypothetical protein